MGFVSVMLAAVAAAAFRNLQGGRADGPRQLLRDGDTTEFGGMAIRLQGLAAPEWNEPGGREARMRQ
jgi:endonuclease YncB( thermonuclease family)